MFFGASVFGGVGAGAVPFPLLSMLGLSIGRHCRTMVEGFVGLEGGLVEQGEVGVVCGLLGRWQT